MLDILCEIVYLLPRYKIVSMFLMLVLQLHKMIYSLDHKHCLRNHYIFTTPTGILGNVLNKILHDLWSQFLASFPSPISHESYFNSLRSLFKFHLLNEAIPKRQWIGLLGHNNENWKKLPTTSLLCKSFILHWVLFTPAISVLPWLSVHEAQIMSLYSSLHLGRDNWYQLLHLQFLSVLKISLHSYFSGPLCLFIQYYWVHWTWVIWKTGVGEVV